MADSPVVVTLRRTLRDEVFPSSSLCIPTGECHANCFGREFNTTPLKKSKCERMEKALADYREQLNRPFEHEERLRELCLKQQEITASLTSTRATRRQFCSAPGPSGVQGAGK
jgi:hypothetical protein